MRHYLRNCDFHFQAIKPFCHNHEIWLWWKTDPFSLWAAQMFSWTVLFFTHRLLDRVIFLQDVVEKREIMPCPIWIWSGISGWKLHINIPRYTAAVWTISASNQPLQTWPHTWCTTQALSLFLSWAQMSHNVNKFLKNTNSHSIIISAYLCFYF